MKKMFMKILYAQSCNKVSGKLQALGAPSQYLFTKNVNLNAVLV